MKHLLFLLPVLVPILCLGLPAGFFIAYALRLRRQRAQPPGPLTCGEVRSRLHAANLSLADRNEIATVRRPARPMGRHLHRDVPHPGLLVRALPR